MAPSVTTAAAGAVAAAAGLYANSHFGFTHDLRELSYEKDWSSRFQKRIAGLGNRSTIYHILQEADPSATALWFEHKSLSYAALRQDADRLATLLAARGVEKGTHVAMMVSNSPEMVIAVCAMSRIGAVPALVNTSLRNETLKYCLDICNPVIALATPDLIPHMQAAHASLPAISFNVGSFPPLEDAVALHPSISQIGAPELVAADLKSLSPPARQTPMETGVYMFTSGTSGKPKAIRIKNFLLVAVSTADTLDVKCPKQYFPLRIYSCLPLFHGTAFFGGFMYAIGNSSTLCLSRKFSASNVAKELHDSRATRMLYVGELCRYMLKAPKTPFDKSHVCRVAYGNGMRPEVWDAFKQRYNIPEIREIYRATDGVARFDNFQRGSKGSGMIGRRGWLRQFKEGATYIVKFDQETQQPYRDPATGHCVPAKAGEPGEALGRVQSMGFYNDYLNNEKANGEKFIRDVFQKGDLFQRSGDLLVRQSNGWIRFYDRSGDTYRWKGENVSAGEVREHIARLRNVTDVSVFATRLENYDGQAGSAEIVLSTSDQATESKFMAHLFGLLRERGLTDWQIPKLVRVLPEIQTTATFKHAASEQKRKVWDPKAEGQSGRLYWLNGRKYEALDENSWSAIAKGEARL